MRLSTLTSKGIAHLLPTVGAIMAEMREDQCPQGSRTYYSITESSALPPADGIASIHQLVDGHTQGIGPQTNERRDTCGTTETLMVLRNFWSPAVGVQIVPTQTIIL